VSSAAAGPRPRRSWRPWVPNAVTFLRAALVPLILVLLAVGDELATARWWAFGIFVAAALTDTFDGWVARRIEGVTAFGAMADPLADKLLVVGTLASLALFAEVPWWIVAVIAGREAVVTALRVLVVRRAGVVVPATVWGKVKTVAQIVAIAAVILPLVDGALVGSLLAVAVLLTIGSGLDYLWRARTLVGLAAADRRMSTASTA
jgi:CDP-diacylglycerol--glycerol-3-phosphate 3-phosphatidyltransferase